MTGTGGAVRWAAFELYHMYGEDEEPHPALISTKSDIYSFGSIILQVGHRSLVTINPSDHLAFHPSDAVG